MELRYNNDIMTNRFDKLEWLKENLSEQHLASNSLSELVAWLSEADFNEFFEYHCRIWNIKTPFDKEDENAFY